ncbi:bactofilin family protein [Sphingomonas sp. PAMC 26605]|uniref:bactofilin family protein n=1 Tax=Sphingomonas sp. PAMC 26605 TaxID=1112214 RepID=UPI00026CA799|nr:polymer-forming cytoskeletal protein [Sphingomonas sp. PAMC 26605]
MAIFTGRASNGSDGSAGHPVPPSSAAAKRGLFSVISADVVITGNIAASADLHVDGRIEGDVSCATLIQGQDSRIAGAVVAETARLGGGIDGSVAVRHLTIERSARIVGDVQYESISIEVGASIDGRLKHQPAESESRSFDRASPVAALRQIEPMRAIENGVEPSTAAVAEG